MDLKSLYTIIAIIAAIIIVEFYKRERNRITSSLHTDNLKQLLTIAALEHQYHSWNGNVIDDSERDGIEKDISLLVENYEKGEIQSSAFQKKMDSLLKKLN